jgi:hypothetical protein
MTLRYNLALRNRKCSSVVDALNNGTFEVRTGTQPANGSNAVTGTLLATIPLPANAFVDPVNGVAAKNGTWTVKAVAAGIAGWGRFKSADGLESMDVSITVTGGGGDLTLDDVDIVVGGNVTVSNFTYTQPAG